LLTVVAGPVFYLAAQMALKWRMVGGTSPRRMLGVGVCLAIGVIGWLGVPAMLVGGLLVAVLVAIAMRDEMSGSTGPREPAQQTA
jgi:hypothetical protein